MDRADDSTQISTLGRLRHWWQRLAGSLLPGRGENAADRAKADLLAQLGELFEEHRAQRGGEAAARARAGQIAAIYRAAGLDERAAILNLITREFAPARDALDAALGAMRTAASASSSVRGTTTPTGSIW